MDVFTFKNVSKIVPIRYTKTNTIKSINHYYFKTEHVHFLIKKISTG